MRNSGQKEKAKKVSITIRNRLISRTEKKREFGLTGYIEEVSGERKVEDENLIQEKSYYSYYIAHSKVQALAFLDNGIKGSNWL